MQLYISHTKQIKRNFHNCIEMKHNLDVIKCYVMLCYVMLCYVMLCYVKTSSLTDIQALDLLNVTWITTAQINLRHEKMQKSFYINQCHLWNLSMFLQTICFFYILILYTFLYLYTYFLLFVYTYFTNVR